MRINICVQGALYVVRASRRKYRFVRDFIRVLRTNGDSTCVQKINTRKC